MADMVDLTAPLTLGMPGRLKPYVDHKSVLAAFHARIILTGRSAAVQRSRAQRITGGEGGIRTPERFLAVTRFRGERDQPALPPLQTILPSKLEATLALRFEERLQHRRRFVLQDPALHLDLVIEERA